ncbi:MAG TPA: hypothetical protein VGA52_14085 [Anaerolineales bacterium]
MRGVRAQAPARKTRVSLLVTAARYDANSGRLLMAQGYEPFGQVWSDIRLYTRDDLIERLQSGQRLGIAETAELATDFERIDRLETVEAEGGPWLRAGGAGANGARDDLGVARF